MRSERFASGFLAAPDESEHAQSSRSEITAKIKRHRSIRRYILNLRSIDPSDLEDLLPDPDVRKTGARGT